jgi:hypothetical protein
MRGDARYKIFVARIKETPRGLSQAFFLLLMCIICDKYTYLGAIASIFYKLCVFYKFLPEGESHAGLGAIEDFPCRLRTGAKRPWSLPAFMSDVERGALVD